MPAMSGDKGSSDWTDSGLVILHTKQEKAEYMQATQPKLHTQNIVLLQLEQISTYQFSSV